MNRTSPLGPWALLVALIGAAGCVDGWRMGAGNLTKSAALPPAVTPRIELNSDRLEAFPGDSITLVWHGEGVERCEANGDWQGSDMAPSGNGTLRVGQTLGAYKYFLTCYGDGTPQQASATVEVVPRGITPAQEVELARAAGVMRAVLDALMLSARYSRPYIESLYAEDGSDLKCGDYGNGSVLATPTRQRRATLVASFSDCADRSVRLAYQDASGLRVSLDPSGVGNWRTFGQLHFGDHRFERGRFAINHGNGADLRIAPEQNGSLRYHFKYGPKRVAGRGAPPEYCGPHRLGSPARSECVYVNADLQGFIDADRTQLRLTRVEAELLSATANGPLKSMSLRAREDILIPILSDGVFAVRFDDIAEGRFEYRREDGPEHAYRIDLEVKSNASLMATVTEGRTGTATTASRAMHWHQFFAEPRYDPAL